MKFLCVPCDEPMKLDRVSPVDRGSVTVIFSCAKCGYETAMLTNPFETQMVASLGGHRPRAGRRTLRGGVEPFSGCPQAASASPARRPTCAG
jgi:hypothetical protein